MERTFAVIYSPFGNGITFIGKWNRSYSPQDMMRANSTSHGFRILSYDEKRVLRDRDGDLVFGPNDRWHPGTWCSVTDELAEIHNLPKV